MSHHMMGNGLGVAFELGRTTSYLRRVMNIYWVCPMLDSDNGAFLYGHTMLLFRVAVRCSCCEIFRELVF